MKQVLSTTTKEKEDMKQPKLVKPEAINDFIRANPQLSLEEISAMTGLHPEAVRGRRRRMKFSHMKVVKEVKTPEQLVKEAVIESTHSKKQKVTDSQFKVAISEIASLQKQLEVFKSIKEVNTYTIPRSKSVAGSEATAVVVASDWHYAESVDNEEVNGLNEFNLAVADTRAKNFFNNTVRLVKIYQKDIKIQTLVLALLGDFINGQLREEAMETNSLQPMEEVLAVQSAIASGIEFILANCDVNLVIPCHSGNHARITEKIHSATESANSLEFLMYHALATHFKDNKRVKFIIPKSYLSYVDVAGFTLRFHHGHALKFAGGIGGLFIPAFKAISQWNKGRKADLDVFGHFHQVKDGGCFISNGSLVGFNAYAVRIKADYEKPKQVFFLIDHKRKEKTVTTSVFLD